MDHEHTAAVRPLSRYRLGTRRPALAALALSVGLLAFTPRPARAVAWVEGFQGAKCAPTNLLGETYWRRNGRKLVNTATDPYQVFLASCPVSLVHDGWRPDSYYIAISDPESRDTYCRVYDSSGTLLRTDWSTGGRPISRAIAYPLGSSSGWVEITFECLLHAGASIDRIEIVWWKP